MIRQKSFEEKQPSIYLVPTPIGNLQEVSPRVLETLKDVDVIACEDTRNSGMLLKKLGIEKPLIAHHEFNQNASVPGILNLIEQGKSVAVISDAGYPLLSDPGQPLVKEAAKGGIPVISMSGPNAALNALVASGLDASHYLFYGFLDSKSSKRKSQLLTLKELPFTMIFYEAPHRIEATLADMIEVFGNRQICLARELTKLHEEYLRGSIEEILEVCGSLKGEMVIVCEGKSPDERADESSVLAIAGSYIQQGLKTKKAAEKAALETGWSKNEIYQLLISQKEKDEE